MDRWDALRNILATSVKRNGERTLTNEWLLNCMRMAERHVKDHEARLDAIEARAGLDE